nr:Uncharacterised protein [Klebsiella pneumoniae]
MENQTRELFDKYIVRRAHLNGVSPSAVANRFSVDPTIQQNWNRPPWSRMTS